MDLNTYKLLVGETSLSDARIEAMIIRTQSLLENLLGYTLDPDLVDTNYYPDLTPVYAFRLFMFNKGDESTRIDPNTQVHSVRFLRQDHSVQEVESDDFSTLNDRGLIKYVSFFNMLFPGWPAFLIPSFINFRCPCEFFCTHLQLIIDADWSFGDELPTELLQVWADMITYYADEKKDIKSQTLGPHSYTKYDRVYPENMPQNSTILARYAGPRGTAFRTIVL